MNTVKALITEYLKAANEAAENNNFRTARTLHGDINDLIDSCEESEREAITLQAVRLKEYIDELEANKGDWLAQWYAGSAGGQ
ncbi:hypothetical protein, partial [Vibrio anguillarum]